MKSYRGWSPTQSFLLPPSPLEWLPEGHLAYFVLDVAQSLDLSAIEDTIQEKDGRGERPYPPAMMVALLVYGYCVGVFSSRRIARATHEDVAFRVIAGGEHPHFTTVNQFRLEHREALAKLFVQVLRLCKKAGLVKLGHANGYLSRENVAHCSAYGVDAYIAAGRDPARAPAASQAPTRAQQARAAMAAKLATADGKAIYARRKCIVEPAFGQIKQARGFRRFSFRGLANVRAEWSFVCATHNLLKLFRRGAWRLAVASFAG